MESEEFVNAVERYALDAAVKDVMAILSRPPGRKPRAHVKERSEWFNQLGNRDKEMIESTIKSTAHAALFHLFAILDGVKIIENSDGVFQLSYISDKNYILNPESVQLHEMLKPYY